MPQCHVCGERLESTSTHTCPDDVYVDNGAGIRPWEPEIDGLPTQPRSVIEVNNRRTLSRSSRRRTITRTVYFVASYSTRSVIQRAVDMGVYVKQVRTLDGDHVVLRFKGTPDKVHYLCGYADRISGK